MLRKEPNVHEFPVASVGQFGGFAGGIADLREAEIRVIHEGECLLRGAHDIGTHAQDPFLRFGKRVFAFPLRLIERALVKRQNRIPAKTVEDLFFYGHEFGIEPRGEAGQLGTLGFHTSVQFGVAGIGRILIVAEMGVCRQLLLQTPQRIAILQRMAKSFRRFGQTAPPALKSGQGILQPAKIFFPFFTGWIKRSQIPAEGRIQFGTGRGLLFHGVLLK